jgi:hypothetical protein
LRELEGLLIEAGAEELDSKAGDLHEQPIGKSIRRHLLREKKSLR